MVRVAVVQDYVPGYRVAFFDLLVNSLAADDITVHIVANRESSTQASRGDGSTFKPKWLKTPSFSPTGAIPFRKRGVCSRAGSVSLRDLCAYDIVVVGLLGSSFASNLVVWRRSILGSPKVVLWGHIAPYVRPGNTLDMCMERLHMLIADAVLAYTRGGARFAMGKSIDPRKIYTLNNTVGVAGTPDALTKKAAVEILKMNDRVAASPIFCFIGALDQSKRVDFLAASLDSLWRLDPSVKVLVGGQGDESARLGDAQARGQVILLGRVGEDEKRAIGALSAAVMCPGRIGLLAVDVLRMGIPVVTLASSMHAPEVEYLTEGRNLLYLDSDCPDKYAELMMSILSGPIRSKAPEVVPSLEKMVDVFAGAVRGLARNGE